MVELERGGTAALSFGAKQNARTEKPDNDSGDDDEDTDEDNGDVDDDYDDEDDATMTTMRMNHMAKQSP